MFRIIIYLILLFLFFSCAIIRVERPEELKKEPPPKEQEEDALRAFSRILDLVNSSERREDVLPQIEALYSEIIRKYPDTPLAQESYWRLIAIYVNDYSPPEYTKAEQLYKDFLKNYPDSGLKGLIDETLGRSYYKNEEWNKLLELCRPEFIKYEEKGRFPRPLLIFMYAEANYNLGNFSEAEKGYRTVIKLFPKAGVSAKSRARLEEMKKPGTKN
jgi:tetratricopeptide (TPR) repeat protein